MQRQLWYLSLLMAILLLAGCRKEPDYSLKNDTPPTPAVDGKTYSAAEIAAFKHMMLEEGATTLTVKKWTRDTVDVYLTDTSNSLLNAELEVIFDDIRTASSNRLIFRRTADSLVAVKIYFAPKTDFLRRFPALISQLTGFYDSRTGYCSLGWGNDFAINYSTIFIDKERLNATPVQLRYVARHELAHALGYLTHINIPDFYASVLYNTYNSVTQFSPFDKRMIGLLYNPAMTAGLTGEALNRLLLEL